MSTITVARTGSARAQTELRGAPASRGHVTGPARIIRTSDDAASLRPGDVLVCAALTPELTSLPTLPAGIITDTGGALSSAAIIARELGIPAVTAAENATTRIRNGQRVTIDGATGAITLRA